jgi:sulfide:quinone oxidoreductase
LGPKRDLLNKGVRLLIDEVTAIDVEKLTLQTASGEQLAYEFLVLATGCRIAPEEVEGLERIWGKTAFDFYTLEGAG